MHTEIGHRFNLRPYVIWKYSLPHRLLFYNHMYHTQTVGLPIKKQKWMRTMTNWVKGSHFIGFIYIVLRRHVRDQINHRSFYQIPRKWGNSEATVTFCGLA